MWYSERVAVVVPAFNEALLLPQTLRRVPEYVDVIVVVDDASTDGTSELALNAGDARVVVVRHALNQGVGAAITSGYRRALQAGADAVVVMAGDDQMDPSDLPALLETLRNGADYAKGNRFLHPDLHRMPKLRRLGSGFLSWLTRLTTRLAVDDCQCGYTAISAAMLRKLPLDSLWPRYGYPNDLLALLAHADARVREVPVRPVYAGERSDLRARHVLGITRRILQRGWWLAQARRGQSLAA
jgi:glycosyltransferase involved in cell wall biosynthesis